MIPPPTPVPIMTPKTTLLPFPAPKTASASAKQLASFSNDTFWSNLSSRSSFSGFPIRHWVLLFFMTPVAGEMAPGVHTPIETSKLFVVLMDSMRDTMRSRIES